MRQNCSILTLNSGSSSIKFSLYALGESEHLLCSGILARIGVAGGFFQIREGDQKTEQKLELPDHDAAWKILFTRLQEHHLSQDLQGVGHRLVHGGEKYIKPQRLSPELLTDLKDLVPLAPDHLPHEIKGMETVANYFPQVPQVACFDTAFHRQMPEVAQRYALPGDLIEAGVRHYGFHGLSYEFLTQELAKEKQLYGKLILAHLGNGASMAAIEGGRSLDTTMGLTPTGGLVMSTRSGDLDPGVVLYLLLEKKMSPEEVNYLLNHNAGLLGVSGTSADMQDLLKQEKTDKNAALAVELFCYQARKFIGALAAVMGGIDTLAFTGGIGEKSAVIRERICANLKFLGISLDAVLNRENAAVISDNNSQVCIRVMPTNEELMIARHTRDVITN
jgi:acetate kinase